MPASPPLGLGPGSCVSHDVGLTAGEDGWISCPENCKEQVKLAQRPLGEAQNFGTSAGMESSSIVDGVG